MYMDQNCILLILKYGFLQVKLCKQLTFKSLNILNENITHYYVPHLIVQMKKKSKQHR